jgi:uncharacterized protein (DUF1330 family)
MPKRYWIVRVDITDQEKYKSYIAANAEPLKKYGARFLVRGGPFENPEGTSRTRNAVIEFPTYQAAIDCWKSPEYQQAIKFRQPVSTIDLVIIEGYEGPQAGLTAMRHQSGERRRCPPAGCCVRPLRASPQAVR